MADWISIGCLAAVPSSVATSMVFGASVVDVYPPTPIDHVVLFCEWYGASTTAGRLGACGYNDVSPRLSNRHGEVSYLNREDRARRPLIRFYDPATAQFLTRDPIESITRIRTRTSTTTPSTSPTQADSESSTLSATACSGTAAMTGSSRTPLTERRRSRTAFGSTTTRSPSLLWLSEVSQRAVWSCPHYSGQGSRSARRAPMRPVAAATSWDAYSGPSVLFQLDLDDLI